MTSMKHPKTKASEFSPGHIELGCDGEKYEVVISEQKDYITGETRYVYRWRRHGPSQYRLAPAVVASSLKLGDTMPGKNGKTYSVIKKGNKLLWTCQYKKENNLSEMPDNSSQTIIKSD